MKIKKYLLAGSAFLLLSLSTGVVNAAESNVSTASVGNEVVSIASARTYTISLKVGQTYQLPYAYGYKYYKMGNESYYDISLSGLLTALAYQPGRSPIDPISSVGILDKNLNDVGVYDIIINP